jgi:hypothetical protein
MAGEALVLANLSVDSSGVVTGVNTAQRSFTSLEGGSSRTAQQVEREWGRAGPAFIHHMFSMRAAAAAFLGTFTLAGLILELSSLAKELITDTEAWRSFSGAVEDSYRSIVKLESSIGQMARHLKTAELAAGLKAAIPSQEDIDKILKVIEVANAEAAKIGRTGGAVPGAAFSGQEILQQSLAARAIDEATRALFKLQEQSGLTRSEFSRLFGVDLENAVIKATKLTEEFATGPIPATEAAFKAVTVSTREWLETLEKFQPLLEAAVPPLNNIVQKVGEIASGWDVAADNFGKMKGQIKEKDTTDDVEKISEAARLASDAFLAFGQSITQHIIQGGLTFKAVFADMLMAMIPVLLGLAAIHLLEWNYAAAAYAFAAAIAVAVAAKALGAGAQKDYGGGMATAQPAGGGANFLNVTFAGPTFGFNEAMFARYVTDLQRRGERTGG